MKIAPCSPTPTHSLPPIHFQILDSLDPSSRNQPMLLQLSESLLLIVIYALFSSFACYLPLISKLVASSSQTIGFSLISLQFYFSFSRVVHYFFHGCKYMWCYCGGFIGVEVLYKRGIFLGKVFCVIYKWGLRIWGLTTSSLMARNYHVIVSFNFFKIFLFHFCAGLLWWNSCKFFPFFFRFYYYSRNIAI